MTASFEEEEGREGPAEDGDREGPSGLERMIYFSDAVVAIAITLVVLPLVDSARQLHDASGLDFVRSNASQLTAAAISFGVIGSFWIEHHHLYERATHGAPRLITVNLLWLAGIMALPVATVLVVGERRTDRSAFTIYVGTIVFLMAMWRLEELLLAHAGALGKEKVDRRLLIDNAVPLILLLLGLVIGLVVPRLGTLPLVLLIFSRPLRSLADRLR